MAKRGLGKGLGALIPTEDASSTGNERPPASTPKQARTEVVESTPTQSASPATNQGAVYAEFPSMLCTPTLVNPAPFSTTITR